MRCETNTDVGTGQRDRHRDDGTYSEKIACGGIKIHCRSNE